MMLEPEYPAYGPSRHGICLYAGTMEWTTTAEVALIGGGVGLGAYCFSCAAHVWRARNAPQRRTRIPRGLRGAVRRGAVVLVVAATLGMAVSIGWWAAVYREGVLEGDGLFTVRRPASLDVVHLTPESQLEQDGVLASFHSPEAGAQIAVLQSRRRSLAAEEQVLLSQILAVDPEIAQKLIDSNSNERTLRTNLSDLILEKERLQREALREQLGRQEDITKREREIRKLEAEVQQSQSALQLYQDDHARSATLRERKAISEQEYAEQETKLEAGHIEVRKLQEQLQQTRQQKAELGQSLDTFRRLSEQQEDDLQKSIAAVQDRLEQVAALQGQIQRQRGDDLRRAIRHRDECLRKIAIETAEVDKCLAAEYETLEKRAPFAGRIVYRAASPGIANTDEPLIVLAPPDGLRLSVRLPNWMKSPLERESGISCKLLEDLERDEQRRFVESQFTARLHRWTNLAAHPGYGLAEFTCELPAEAVRLLARGEQIAARLVWRPPLYSVPTVILCLVVAAMAGTAWVATASSPGTEPVRSPSATPSAMNGHGTLGEVSTEFGAEGALLRLLGTQLREMTARGELDANVIGAAEWALTRHRHRAVRLLSLGLGNGPDLSHCLEVLVMSVAPPNGYAKGDRMAVLRRLVAVLQAAAPEGSYEAIHRIARRLAQPVSHGPGRRRRQLQMSRREGEAPTVNRD